MRIGLIYDDVNRKNLDCSNPQYGNPGVGGTQYCYLMFLYYYSLIYPEDELIVYRYRNIEGVKLPLEDKILYKNVPSIVDCVVEASKDNVDMLLFTHDKISFLDNAIRLYHVQCIVWIHNWIRGELLEAITKNEYIKKVVFLVEEHYDRYIDHPIIKKAAIIQNMFDVSFQEERFQFNSHNVTYSGAIIPGKGFDVLAKAWPKVLSKVPDAQLYVIGAGNLYGKEVQYGPLGIADINYEKKFIQYVTDSNKKVLPSVHFLGILGAEKKDIYKKTKVGVINPSGKTEVCPISALEMEAMSIPIVSRDKNGIPNVVINRKTGLLINHEGQLSKAIVQLLLNDDLNRQYGDNAKEYVRNNFSPEIVIKLWKELFIRVSNNINEEQRIHFHNLNNNYKWIRIVNSKLKRFSVLSRLPAIIDLEAKLSSAIRGR